MSGVSEFRLFANCVPVRGARRSVICDLQRQRIDFIPNGLFEILTAHRGRSVDELCVHYGEAHRETIVDYFTFLVEKELGFWTTDPDRFPPLDLSFDAPGLLDAAIIDVDADSTHDFGDLVRQLNELGCRYLQVRCYVSADSIDITEIFRAVADSRLRALDLTIGYTPELTTERLVHWCAEHGRLSGILVHGAPTTHMTTSPVRHTPIRFISRVIQGAKDCGSVHPAYFAPNLAAFIEGLHFNSCLNRKISIDRDGQICNCPAMAARFGASRNVALRTAVESPSFRAVWTVRKDDIDVCRDCEFRYVCPDCRAHVTDPANPRSKPAGCHYDPYTATWGTGTAVAQ